MAGRWDVPFRDQQNMPPWHRSLRLRLRLAAVAAAAVTLATAAAAGSAAPACPAALPPAPVAVKGFAMTSAAGCIGAQGSDATNVLAWQVDCSQDGLNLTAAAERLATVCTGTPGCAAFSIDSPSLPRSRGRHKLCVQFSFHAMRGLILDHMCMN